VTPDAIGGNAGFLEVADNRIRSLYRLVSGDDGFVFHSTLPLIMIH
jgi:hypothetical protein